MGKIVRNGIEFSSTSDTADNINYNNSKSGLSAVTAQEAIDEVNGNVSELNENVSTLNSSLGGVNFITEEGKGITGYTLIGADTVYPFRKEPYLKLVSTSRSFNISSIVGAENIAKYTKDDFIVCNTTSDSGESGLSGHNSSGTTCASTRYVKVSDPTVSYNASTGAVTISGGVYRTFAYLKLYDGSQYNTSKTKQSDYNMSIAVYLMVKT